MDWVDSEFSTLSLGDERLNNRAKKLLRDMSGDPNSSLPKQCQSWSETKAAYRFFSHDMVSENKILKPHREQTIKRIQAEARVLLVQDTTELNYTGQVKKQGVGPGHRKNEQVFFYHPLLAVTPDRRALGVVDIHSWYREALLSHTYTKQERNNMLLHKHDISEKESYRWLSGYHKATKLAQTCSGTHLVMVADREADIADIYDTAEQLDGIKADWLVRAKEKNRVLVNEDGTRGALKLKEELATAAPIGQIKFTLPRREGKPSRQVEQTLRVKRLLVHPPTGRRGKLRLKPFWVTAILTQEETPPDGEPGIEWLLLTSVQLTDSLHPKDIVQWYLCRWQIEVFFYILKSGCCVEKLQLTCPTRFLPCLAMYSIIAWRILMMTHCARVSHDETCEILFTTKEWQCVYINLYKKKPPTKPPSIASMVKDIAKLGGFLARKSDGEPGPKTIWLGLKKLHDFTIAIENYQKVQT